MKRKWCEMYLDIAERIAQESHAVRLKVGAVFVSSEGVMSTGINGLPAGGDNVCEYKSYGSKDPVAPDVWDGQDERGYFMLHTKPEVAHAEEQLFSKLMRQGVSTIGGDIFVTARPCIHCAKIIVGAGIARVYYRSDYGESTGVDWLRANNVIVIKLAT